MSTVSRLYPLSGLAALVLVGCSSQPAQPLKKGEKAVDVASVARQKMPASVKDRDAWAQDLAKTFESQKLAPTVENICSVLAVAQQESNFQADPAVPGLSKIAWKEIDRRAERMHIPLFVVHTALKINSPTGKSYSERLDTVKTEKQLSAIFDDFINMVPMGQTLFGSLNPVHTGGPMQVSIAFAEQHTSGYPWKMAGTVRQEVFSRRGGLWFGTYHLLNYPANYSAPIFRFADFNAGWYASRNAGRCRLASPLLSSMPAATRGKWREPCARKYLAAAVGCGSVRIICLTTRRITVRQFSASPISMPGGMPAAMQLSRMRSVKPAA
jgi:Protein of unknown function (DUF1615).